MQHAKIFSASALPRLFACPGSAVLAADAERTSNQYSAWGTACHQLAADALTHGDSHYVAAAGTSIAADGFEFIVDSEMIDCARVHTDYVRDVAGADGTILVEQRVDYSRHLALPAGHDGWGTADAIIVRGSEMIVVDLKTGRGVEVEAQDNEQLYAYALGCLDIAEQVADIERVRITIVQPRAGGIKEHDMPVEELLAWASDHAISSCQQVLQAIADHPTSNAQAFADAYLRPGEKQCKFCPAKATCSALRDAVAGTVINTLTHTVPASPDEFTALQVSPPAETRDSAEWLAACLSKVDMIEDWCQAVRTEAFRRLNNGLPVPGFKLVQGKRGNRAWSDPTKAEELLRKTFRLPIEQAYDLKLISPTTAEKLVKAGAIGPRQWEKAKDLITQPDGKPSVAPESDSRPALIAGPVAEEFPALAGNLV